jgi:SAM-dependent methyltransferase
MNDARNTNRRLWNEWSDAFQALWNADTDGGGLPSAPCPFTSDTPGGAHPDLLPSVAGVDVVELGCGGGQASVGTAAEGAGRVVGVDVQFVAGDVTNLPLADDAFDVAFSGWVVQLIEDFEAFLTESRRVLRDEGVLVVDVPHPFYELFDPSTESLERSYHGPDRRTITIDEAYEADLIVFDRTVSDLHNALVDAGFDVRRGLEPGSDDPEAYDDDPLDSNRPALMAQVPRTLRFCAVVR